MPFHLGSLWNAIQTHLFPIIEETIGSLTDREKRFVRMCELLSLEKHLSDHAAHTGRPPAERLPMARAFIAKSLYNFPTTKILREHLLRDATLRRLCGWTRKGAVPSESTFSRAFADFAASQLPERVHHTMITTHYGNKVAGHISRDATAIEAREKPLKKTIVSTPATPRPPGKRGQRRSGEKPPAKKPTPLEIQLTRTPEENRAAIPTHCDWGAKRDSKGYTYFWIGYKLHIDTIDGDIPVAVLLSSASMHDSLAAILLAQISAPRVINLYDIMDAAYDAEPIRQKSRSLNHIPIIDHNRRRGERKELCPARKQRYTQRTAAERVNSNLKDNYGGSHVRVRGATKVMAHLMFGIVALTAEALFRLLP